MPVTLNEAKSNAVEDLDVAVIDEFRKESAILDELATQRSAASRAYNTEYTPEHVTTTKVSVTLALLGGSFEVDRVLAKIGPAASGSVALNLQDAVINGDTRTSASQADSAGSIPVSPSTFRLPELLRTLVA